MMRMATSLNKAYASGGAVLVYGNKEMARKVSTVGGPLLSSGPMQPSALGDAIASAEIHLSDEIISMQTQLQNNIQFTCLMIAKYKLPMISQPGAAIFFVAVSLPGLGHNVVKKMFDAGFYVNLGIFPTVPMKQTGIRFTITRLHTFQVIEGMIASLAYCLSVAMQEENITIDQIYKAFKIPLPEEAKLFKSPDQPINQTSGLKLYHYKSILEINEREWNELFEGKGTFDWENLKILETVFTSNTLPEDNWVFDYVLVKDLNERIITAVFFTTALWKDDMLSNALISKQIENKRIPDPYYLTSMVICSGSLITEGDHLYIDFSSSVWKQALHLLLKKIYVLQELNKANHIVLRDFKGLNQELDDFMVDNGYFKIKMPDSHLLPITDWNNEDELYQSLSTNNRNHLRKKVLRNQVNFKIETSSIVGSKEKMKDWYKLYLNVKNKNLDINTFPLPLRYFESISKNESWEKLELTINDPVNQTDIICCIVFSLKTKDSYIPMIIGLDYSYNSQFGVYRQALYQLILRAKKLQKEKVALGFSASVEKQKFGIKPQNIYAYMHSKDSYNLEALSTISIASDKTI